jgi:predicted O-methyltransferase YrrM
MSKLIGFIIKYVFSALSCLYLHTIGFIFAKNRTLMQIICTHFGYREKQVKPILPKVELSELIPDENIPIVIREALTADGNISLFELMTVAKLIKRFDPKKIFEIGTFDGRTTLNMAVNSSPEAKVYTLDLPKQEMDLASLQLAPADKAYINKDTIGLRYSGTDCEEKIVQLYGDSAKFDFSPFINEIDLAFIDGSHSYEYVKHDSKKALNLLKDGKGVIIWHDYDGWSGVTKALNELYREDEFFKGLLHINETSLVCLINDYEKISEKKWKNPPKF